MNSVPLGPNDLLTSAEVASLLAVGPKTVRRWAMAGKITSISTPGGHRRFLRSEIDALVVDSNVRPPPDQQPVPVRATASPAEPDREDLGHFGRMVAGLIAEAVMVAAREESGGSYSLVAELVAETAVLAARAAQADRAPGDLPAASAAVVVAARRTASAVRRLYEARAQAAEEAAEAIADHAFRTTSDLRDRADASGLAFTVAVSDMTLDDEAAEVAAALRLATTARPRHAATETDAQAMAMATADSEPATSG